MQGSTITSEKNFLFVSKNGKIDTAAAEMKESFQVLENLGILGKKLSISEDDCFLFPTIVLTANDVFIFEKCDGKAFNFIASTKARILGPKTLINRYLKGYGTDISDARTISDSRTFVISSSFTDADITFMTHKLRQLGASVLPQSERKVCTHFICQTPNRGETVLCTIASGGWLLIPAYVHDSFKSGQFLPEDDYEMGNPTVKQTLPSLDASKIKTVEAAYKWRIKLMEKTYVEGKPVGIFSNFRIILHSRTRNQYQVVLEAGCGVVTNIDEPYWKRTDLKSVTHCFVSDNIHPISCNDRTKMKDVGVHLVTMLYFHDCLLNATVPLNATEYEPQIKE